ncbi:serine hydrolase [Paludisphaera soli]|uniref:serine hydrolase n=1 Tax=Paludisphaera soli TaxID=2712865 RepID=UPI0013EA9586|nr:serine hydrolase [Paludisphaera soli]
MKTSAALFVGLAAAALASSARAQEAPGPETVDSYVREVMAKRHVPGVSIAVVRDGKTLLAKGFGLADVELNVPATEETVYQLASVTKTFTAAGVMLLVKDGKLALDDKVADRVPGLPDAWKDVTIQQLLSHTSGIKSYTSVEGFEKSVRKDFAPREILDLVAKEPLEFAPGEKWNYSNTGYFLLGMLIEEVAGKPYAAFMSERVFEPLGMERTRVNDLKAIIPGRASGYGWDDEKQELRNGEYVSPTQPFAAGALVSTVADLAKWDAALVEGSLLDKPTLERMWTPARLKDGEAGYGLGWAVGKANGARMVSHGGGIPGFSTEIARFPDDGLTVIVLTNAEGGHAGAIARGIAGRFVPALAEKPDEPIADADEATSRRLRGFFEGLSKGEIDPELFGDEAKKVLVPRIEATKAQMASLGAVRDFQLLERKEESDGLRVRYRVAFEKRTLKASFALDKDGKIRGAMVQPED